MTPIFTMTHLARRMAFGIRLAVMAAFLAAAVAAAQDDFDFGDAPNAGIDPMWSYPTLLAEDGARHLVPMNPTHFLGDVPTPFITIMSVDSSGVQADSDSRYPSISADGRYVAFHSFATNLVPGDDNGAWDVFVHDRLSGATSRISVDSSGVQSNSYSLDPSISADGRYVAFRSYATNLVTGDDNGAWDIFVHDRLSGATSRVSVDSAGVQGNYDSQSLSISADGRYVAFSSEATNLVPGDTNGKRDVFVHDRLDGATSRVSVDSAGVQGSYYSDSPSISADGRYLAFRSLATNLVPGDDNGTHDVFVHDRLDGATSRVSVDSSGVQGNNASYSPSISTDGRYVAFSSSASNLVPGDDNGVTDVFVHDRLDGATSRVSVDSAGVQGNDWSSSPSISADGRHVAFKSDASNLAPSSATPWSWSDVFVHDRLSGTTFRVSVSSAGIQGNGDSSAPSISADGHYVTFHSTATNLVLGDANGFDRDVFVHGEHQTLDADDDGAPSVSAAGDDGDGNDDEDGVFFPCCMVPGQNASLQIDVSAAGFVNAWIDFDGDGDWGDTGEQILADHAVAAGSHTISYFVEGVSPIPDTYARVRFTSYDTAGSLGVTGLASDGSRTTASAAHRCSPTVSRAATPQAGRARNPDQPFRPRIESADPVNHPRSWKHRGATPMTRLHGNGDDRWTSCR